MLLRLSSVLLLSLLLLPAHAALAIPVTIEILSGTAPGIKFSFLHTADAAEANIGDNQFFRGGDKFRASGTLTGDLTGTVLTISAGTIALVGLDDIAVSSGRIEWPGLDPDFETNAFIGTIDTLNYGTFHFFDNQSVLSVSAQTFDGERAILWGNNWTGPAPDPNGQCVLTSDVICDDVGLWGLDLGLQITPAPEVATSLLLASGLAGLLIFGRRR